MDIYYSSGDQFIRDFSRQENLHFEIAAAILSLRNSPLWSTQAESTLRALNHNFSREKLGDTLDQLDLDHIKDELCIT